MDEGEGESEPSRAGFEQGRGDREGGARGGLRGRGWRGRVWGGCGGEGVPLTELILTFLPLPSGCSTSLLAAEGASRASG